MSEISKVIDLDSNEKLEEITESAKESNASSNAELYTMLEKLLGELKEINKQLKKISK
jgi:hypothetical protein